MEENQLTAEQLAEIAALEAAAALEAKEEAAKIEKKVVRAYTASAIVGGTALFIGAFVGFNKGYSWAFYLLLAFILAPAAGSVAGVIAFNI